MLGFRVRFQKRCPSEHPRVTCSPPALRGVFEGFALCREGSTRELPALDPEPNLSAQSQTHRRCCRPDQLLHVRPLRALPAPAPAASTASPGSPRVMAAGRWSASLSHLVPQVCPAPRLTTCTPVLALLLGSPTTAATF